MKTNNFGRETFNFLHLAVEAQKMRSDGSMLPPELVQALFSAKALGLASFIKKEIARLEKVAQRLEEEQSTNGGWVLPWLRAAEARDRLQLVWDLPTIMSPVPVPKGVLKLIKRIEDLDARMNAASPSLSARESWPAERWKKRFRKGHDGAYTNEPGWWSDGTLDLFKPLNE